MNLPIPMQLFQLQFQSPQVPLEVRASLRTVYKIYGHSSSDSCSVTHASEVFFVYGSPDAATPSSIALSSTMQDYWISFAVTLDPNDGKGNQSKIPSKALMQVIDHHYLCYTHRAPVAQI